MVVPKQQLREIRGMDLNQVATILPATTEPSTQPATQPTTEVTITLDEVRQMALENNLDLKVELLNPTIAQTQVSEEQARFESLFTTNWNRCSRCRNRRSRCAGIGVHDGRNRCSR